MKTCLDYNLLYNTNSYISKTMEWYEVFQAYIDSVI